MATRPTSIDDTQFHRIARALADPQRCAILEMLSSADEVACQALVERFDVTQATISHHLKALQFTRLVDGRRDGRCFHFKL
jgi:DNA-binding transcriptional ArsR family regulator